MNAVVAILGNKLDAELKQAFQDLAAVLNLHIEFSNSADLSKATAIVCIGSFPKHLPPVPRFQFISENLPATGTSTGTLTFGNHPALPLVLRGQTLELGKEPARGVVDTRSTGAGDVIASVNGEPIWTIAITNGVPVWSISTAPPRLPANTRLAHCLNGETFLPLLPVYLFLRALSPESRWQAPPLRACMVVDDPNLHRSTYGHIRFKDLVQYAREQPFHAAMATIPLDTWWTSVSAARTFRENPQALSLLVHGNDHSQGELARPYQNGQCDALVMQSLSRIQAWESRKNVRVDRVMAPPHGVCSSKMISALHAGGYDGMTTNRWSLWQHNPPERLPVDYGLRPADMLGGLPVLGRFRFHSSICAGESLIAALVGQPIIPYGHHQDFAGDMVHVKRAVRTINSLPVRWMSLNRILESNFEHYQESGTLHLRLYSRRVKVALPPGAHTVQIHTVPQQSDTPQSFEITLPQKQMVLSSHDQLSDLPAGAELQIAARAATPAAKTAGHRVRTSPTVTMRRLASEMRDRLKI